MRKLLAIAILAAALSGCGGQYGAHSGMAGECTNATIFGDCGKSCVRQHDSPSACGCTKKCSCWPSHPGGEMERAEKK